MLKGEENFPFVMFLPQHGANCWFDVFEQLKAFVKTVIELLYIDKQNMYLSGVSLGGYACWQMLMSEPNIFRKAVICCGGNAKLTAYEGVGHNCWEKAYSCHEIYKWLLDE